MISINKVKDSFLLSTDNSLLSPEVIHEYLSGESYWSPGIPIEKVKSAIEHSLNFGIYAAGKQVAYARVVSDYTSIAYLGDVFVLPAFRGQGLSKWLMQEVRAHPSLQGLRRWILLTKDAHSLYEQFGWKTIADPSRWMEIYTAAPWLNSNAPD